MQKVIGLDIGSYSIKAIEIVNTFKSYEITNFYETIIPPLREAPLELVIATCMEQLFSEHQIEADRIITAMPGQFISSRVLSFNYNDVRKIRSAIMLDLEERVPFNMEDMIVDHQILGTIDGQTLALAVMTRKVFLRNFLDLLARIKIDPKLVDVDSLAFYNLASHMGIQEENCYAMVDVGHEKTAICIMQAGVLRMFRSINLGGRYITDFMARDLGVSFSEAQRIKHRVSRVFCNSYSGEDLSQQDIKVAERMTLATNAIVKELGRTFYAFKSWEKRPLSKIYLTGGTSRLQYFAEFLSEQLDVPVEHLRLDRVGMRISTDLQPHLEIIPQSLAIGVRAVASTKNHSQINMRRGEFAFVQNYENILKNAATAFHMIAASILVLIACYVIKFYFYNAQIERLKESYIKEYVADFPDAKKKATPTAKFANIRNEAETKFKNAIKEKKAGVEAFKIANRESAALRVLKEISEALPKEVVIDVTLFDFKTTSPGNGKLTLRAETDNFASQATIMDALKKVAVLRDVTEKASGAKPGSDGKKIEFTVDANYSAG